MSDIEGEDLQDGGAAPSPEPVKGLDAIIDSAISKLEGQDPDSPLSHDRELEAVSRTDAKQPRHPDGKFAPKDKAAEASQEPAKVATTTADQPTAVEPAAMQPLDPHPRWSDADKAVFAKLPRDAQHAWLESAKRQEADYTRKTQELAEQRKPIEPLLNTVSGWSQYLRQLNLSPDQAFDQLMRTEFILRTGTPQQKAEAFAYLQQLYGLPSATGQQTPQAPSADEWVDPEVLKLRQVVQQLQGSIQGIQQQSKEFERAQAEAEFSAIFATKDEGGNPKYPHIGRVRDAVIHMVAQGYADTWDDAYKRAVRMDDELYSQEIEAERKRAVEALEKQRQEAVQKARGAAPVQASHGSPKGATKLKGLDAVLDAAISAQGIT